MSTDAPTTRRLPHLRMVIAALVLVGALVAGLVVSAMQRETAEAPGMEVAQSWGLNSVLLPEHVVIASDILRADGTSGSDRSQVQIVGINGESVGAPIDPGSIHPHVITNSSRSRIFAIGSDLVAIDAISGTELWRTDAPSTRLVRMGALGVPTLALSNNGRWLFVANERPNSPADMPFWLDIIDAETGAHLATTDEMHNCGPARLLPRPEPTNLVIACLGRRALHLLTLEPTSASGNTTALRGTTLTQISDGPQVPGRLIDASLTPNGEQVLFVSETLHVALFDWATQTMGDSLPLLTADEQLQWQAQAATSGYGGPGLALFVTLTAVEPTVPGASAAPERPSELRIFNYGHSTQTWSQTASMQLPNRPLPIPFDIDVHADTAYLVDYTIVEGRAEPVETRVLAVTPATGAILTLVSRTDARIVHATYLGRLDFGREPLLTAPTPPAP